MFMRPDPEYEWKLYLVIAGQFFAKRELLILLNGTHLQEEQRTHAIMSSL